MSGHAQGLLAQLRQAEQEPNIDVDETALRDATIEGLREHADDIDEFRTNALVDVDGPLADTSAYLRALADALEDGATTERELRTDADFTTKQGGEQ